MSRKLEPNRRNTCGNIVCVEGINREGFGIIPARVMLDPELTAMEKAVYSYFASFTGGGRTRLPSVSFVLEHLGIGRTSYTRYCGTLISQGYITAEENISENNRLVYTLPNIPSKYLQEPNTPEIASVYADVRRFGICVDGFGTMPRLITTNKELSLVSKAVYAIRSVCSNGEDAYPSKEYMARCLRLSRPTFNKHLTELINHGYVFEQDLSE